MSRRIALWGGIAALGLAAGFSYWRSTGSNVAEQKQLPETVAISAAEPFMKLPYASFEASPELPSHLQGTSAPPLPLDGGGRLLRVRAVRDFYDYFLIAQNQLQPAALDGLVNAAIRAQLNGKPAAAEAAQLWQRYRDYLAALEKLSGNGTQVPTESSMDLDAISRTLDQQAQLAAQYLGEWQTAFFGDELNQQRFALAKVRIDSDNSLSAAEKARRKLALEQSLPAAERQALERSRREEASIQGLQQALQQGDSPEKMQALAQQLGPEVAASAQQFAQQEREWKSRYQQYAEQAAQLKTQQLAPQDRVQLLAQLRRQLFASPGDALRAEAHYGE